MEQQVQLEKFTEIRYKVDPQRHVHSRIQGQADDDEIANITPRSRIVTMQGRIDDGVFKRTR
jgi:hypothetical protein